MLSSPHQAHLLANHSIQMAISLQAMRKAQRAQGPATILAVGTANPPNLYEQDTYPDYYFRVTNSEHKQELKNKFRRMCKFFDRSFWVIFLMAKAEDLGGTGGLIWFDCR